METKYILSSEVGGQIAYHIETADFEVLLDSAMNAKIKAQELLEELALEEKYFNDGELINGEL